MSPFFLIPFVFVLDCYADDLHTLASTVDLVKKKVEMIDSKVNFMGNENQKYQEKNTKALEDIEKLLAGLAGIIKRVDLRLQTLPTEGNSRIDNSIIDNLKTNMLGGLEDLLIENLEVQTQLLKKDLTKKFNELSTAIIEGVEASCMKENAKITAKLSELEAHLLSSIEKEQNEDNSRFPINYTSQKYRSCSELQESTGYTTSGVYEITPESFNHSLTVYCDLETNGGGWTVILRRDYNAKPYENFDRSWEEYKKGFGDPEKEFWIGNEALHILTKQSVVTLRVELTDINGLEGYGEFSGFFVGSEKNKYKLNVKTLIEGNIGSPIKSHDHQYFSANNVDNDGDKNQHCSKALHGGWWFSACGNAYLNGPHEVPDSPNGGITWEGWGSGARIIKVQLKVQSELFKEMQKD